LQRGEAPIRTRFAAPVVLSAMIVVCAVVAALLGQPVWAAAVGAALVLGYWVLEVAAMRVGAAVSVNQAVGVALVGMVLRLAFVLGVLVLVAMLWRPALATMVLAFVVSFTVHLGVRVLIYPFAKGSTRTVRAR